MTQLDQSCRNPVSRFLRDESGSATMEMVLWLPFFLFLLFLTVDGAILYWRHGEMWNVARDVARAAAAGTLDTTDQTAVDQFVLDRFGENTFSVQASESGGDVDVSVTRARSAVTTFSFFENYLVNLNAQVTMRMEP